MTTFIFKTLENKNWTVNCEVYSYPRSWGHRCWSGVDGECNKHHITYYNRTWESFQFESLLFKALQLDFGAGSKNYAFIKKQIEAIAMREREKAQKWADEFSSLFSSLSDEKKRAFYDSDIFVENESQAEALAGLVKLASII